MDVSGQRHASAPPFRDSSARLTEVLAVSALLIVVAVVLMGGHVLNGGLYTDDWSIAAIQRHAGTWQLFDKLLAANHDRPLAALYLAATASLSGTSGEVHAIWGFLTHLVAVVSLYLLLRTLRLPIRHAVALALLILAFPFSDSLWLWYSTSHASIGIAFAALGGVVALQGLQYDGRGAVARHSVAVTLFAASILTYQVAALAICLFGVTYLSRTVRRRALACWGADIAVVVMAVGLPRLITGSQGSTANPIIPVTDQIEHARLIADQAASLLTAVIVPIGRLQHRAAVSSAVLVLTLAAIVVVRVNSVDEATRQQLRCWLTWGAAGVVTAGTAYAVYVPASIAFYQPLGQGEDNRVNALAGIGFVLIAYSAIMLLSVLAARALRQSPARAGLIGALLAGLLFVAYGDRVRRDVVRWDAAARSQDHQLAVLKSQGRPLRGSTLHVFGGRGITAPGVYAFRVTWDLNAAVQLMWNDPTLRAYPIFAGVSERCGVSRVLPLGLVSGDPHDVTSAYGRTVFVDLRSDRRVTVASRKTCFRVVPTFVPGQITG